MAVVKYKGEPPRFVDEILRLQEKIAQYTDLVAIPRVLIKVDPMVPRDRAYLIPTSPSSMIFYINDFSWEELEVTEEIIPPTRSPVQPRTIADYPHLCPRCQSPAYIGLNKVEHFLTELDVQCK